jgi:hypothetical protein
MLKISSFISLKDPIFVKENKEFWNILKYFILGGGCGSFLLYLF